MRFYILFIFFSLVSNVFSQGNNDEFYDSAARVVPKKTSSLAFYRNMEFKAFKDSSMLFLNQYDKIKRTEIGIQNLGDVSTPYLTQQFYLNKTSGFQTGFSPYKNIFLNSNDIEFYSAKMPYTEFQYTQGNASAGNNGLINFNAFHTQNIKERFNVSARFYSNNNVGFYLRQKNIVKNLQVSSYYYTKNKRFNTTMAYTWNKANMEQNGGILPTAANDSLFKRLDINFRQVPVSLTTATNINKSRNLEFSQTYWLIRIKKDSANYTNVLGIRHHLDLQKQTNYYKSRGSDFRYYDNRFYACSDLTQDSMVFTQITNNFELFTPLNGQAIAFKAGISHQKINFFQQTNEQNYHRLIKNNLNIYGALNFDFLKKFESEITGSFYLLGFNQADYQLEWKNKITVLKQWHIEGSLFANSRMGNYIFLNNFSNHYQWQNNFEKTNQNTLRVSVDKDTKRKGFDAYSYSLPKKSFGASLQYALIDNYMFFDKNGFAQQTGKGQNALQANVYKQFNLKKWHLYQALNYQLFSPDLSNALLLPQIVSKSSIYYSTFAFKKATYMQMGFDVYYTNSYRANQFNPALQNFVQSDQKVGAYPFVDIFLQAQIRTARFYAVIEHVNQYVEQFQQGSPIGYQYSFPNYLYTSPFQPSAPRRFRLGFVWMFFY